MRRFSRSQVASTISFRISLSLGFSISMTEAGMGNNFSLRSTLPPPPPGGGGYFHMYAYWVCAARETPIFSPKFPFRSISFSQITKKSVPEHHHFTFFGGFAVPETIIFKISLISTRSSPPTAGSARTQSVRQRRGFTAVPEIRIFTLKADQARSGD